VILLVLLISAEILSFLSSPLLSIPSQRTYIRSVTAKRYNRWFLSQKCIAFFAYSSSERFDLTSRREDTFSLASFKTMATMSSTQSEILKACKDEELSRVRELYSSMSDSASKGSTLDAMILTAAENNRPEIVQFCLDEGAEASYEVIIEAYDHPTIAQMLITAGAMDVNHDFEMAGDLLINAICGRNVSSSDHSLCKS
jgi:hypothetical protein